MGRYGWKGGKGVGAEKGSTSLIKSQEERKIKTSSVLVSVSVSGVDVGVRVS